MLSFDKKETIGGHPVKDLSVNNDGFLVGYVANKYNPEDWEKTTWSECNIVKQYYCSPLGENFDIDFAD